MNPIDTTDYLFAKETDSQTVNVLPWLDQSITGPFVNENVSDESAAFQNSSASRQISETANVNAINALRTLQNDFGKYDTDKSGALSYGELLAVKDTDASASWALKRHQELSNIAKSDYSSGFIGTSEDIIARHMSNRRVPLELANSMFSDPIPSLLGISQKDLSTAIDAADPNSKLTGLLESSAEKERGSRWCFLGMGIADAALTSSMFKLGSRVAPWLGYVAGGLFALSGVAQFNHFLSRGRAENTREIEEEINKTRQILGLENIEPIVGSKVPESEEGDKEPTPDDKKEQENN